MKRIIKININGYQFKKLTDKPVVEDKIEGKIILKHKNIEVIESDDYLYIDGEYDSELIDDDAAKELEREEIATSRLKEIKVYDLYGNLVALYPNKIVLSKIEGYKKSYVDRLLYTEADRAIVKNWYDIPVVYVVDENIDDILYMINDDYYAYTTPTGIGKVKVIKSRDIDMNDGHNVIIV